MRHLRQGLSRITDCRIGDMINFLNKTAVVALITIAVFASIVLSQSSDLRNHFTPRETAANSQTTPQVKREVQPIKKEHSEQTRDEETDLVEYQKVQERVRLLSEAKDLYGLVQLSDGVESVWGSKSPKLYAGLMVDICGTIGSRDFNNNEQYILARKCIKRALKKADQMPVEWQAKLVSFLRGDIEYLLKLAPEEDWSSDRKERMKYWCDTWQRFENEIDENFNFEANRVINHPKLTDAERRRAENYTRQRILRRDRESSSIEFRKFLVESYTKPPYNTPELENFLQKCVTDVEMRKSIVLDVQRKILEKRQEYLDK